MAPLSAGGTLYSDEREILDAERDYWLPRVAIHFGAKLLKWAMLDLGQGISARVLEFVESLSTRTAATSEPPTSVRPARPVPKTYPQIPTALCGWQDDRQNWLIRAVFHTGAATGFIDPLRLTEVLR
jgi:hypothetical protein